MLASISLSLMSIATKISTITSMTTHVVVRHTSLEKGNTASIFWKPDTGIVSGKEEHPFVCQTGNQDALVVSQKYLPCNMQYENSKPHPNFFLAPA